MSREQKIYEGTHAIIRGVDSSGVNSSNSGNSGRLYGRVVNIVMSEDDVLFGKYGALETIEFEPIQDITSYTESGNKDKVFLSAYKLHSHVKTPLINEVVPIVSAPDMKVQLTSGQFAERFYYDDPISVFTSVESNPAPDQNTIQNLLPGSSQQDKYQKSTLGIVYNGKSSETVPSKDKIKLGEYFTERGVKALAPLEGDVKHEGRFGNSIRFAGTPNSKVSDKLPWKGKVGSPVTIIRNGQNTEDKSFNGVYEDINKDGSSMYLFSDQTVDLVLANNNFDSYNQQNENSSPNIVVSTPTKQSTGQSANSSDDITASEPIVPNISKAVPQSAATPPLTDDLKFVPDNENDLNFVSIGEDIPVEFTNGLVLNNNYNSNYKLNPATSPSSVVNNSLVKLSSKSVTTVKTFSGNVMNVPNIDKNGKALLDLIAFAEGMMGSGQFNGYDMMIGYYKFPNFNAIYSSLPHPNIKIKIDRINNYSSATGRYQFNINTWNGTMGKNAPMTVFNQDYAAWKKVREKASIVSIDHMDTDHDAFNRVIDSIAGVWASLPALNNPRGKYNQGGRYTFDQLYNYYKQILEKY